MATNENREEEARDWRLSGFTYTSAEICQLRDRVQVEDIIVNTNIPPFNASATDGFCMTFAGVRYTSPEAHVRLSGSGRHERMVVHGQLTNEVESNVHESYLRSVVQCRGKCSKSA